MPDPRIPGRMIRRSIATDPGVARLTAVETAILCMVIPHLDSYGKMLGSAAVVKETCLPRAPWATVEVIEEALKAISRHTGVKVFKGKDGRIYIHAIHFERHQRLEKSRRGADLFPDYPGKKSASKSSTKSTVSRRRVDAEVEVEVEVQGKEKEEVKGTARPLAPSGGQAAASSDQGNGKGTESIIPGIVQSLILQAPPELRGKGELLYLDRDVAGLATLLSGKMPETMLSTLIDHTRRRETVQ